VQNIVPITDLQQKTKKYVNRVRATGVPVVITQRGRAVAILVSAEDFESYLIPVDEKMYPGWRAKLSRGLKQLDAGEGVELQGFLKDRKKRKTRGKGA
jgi:prevent-host-death family protein